VRSTIRRVEKLYVLERARDGKRFEFFKEMRGGKLTYIIRERGLSSQDSETTDRLAIEHFRQGLLRDGFMQMPLTDIPQSS
jgi:hypothetical protein